MRDYPTCAEKGKKEEKRRNKGLTRCRTNPPTRGKIVGIPLSPKKRREKGGGRMVELSSYWTASKSSIYPLCTWRGGGEKKEGKKKKGEKATGIVLLVYW